MRIQESGEMYLESIYVLLKKNGNVRSVDIAEYMGYSKPSISRAMGLLKDGDFIRIAKDGSITLTRAGIAVAEKIYERHTLLTNLLIRLGVSTEVASEDACKLEHAISDESFEAIKKFVTDYENKPAD
ncbi:MAG: metal-dependent transcriptional regulator [Oscillospiraceae bacterium]|nr:metal-dependent transcriptional regulator [Oscillospiraceae bacterium]